MQSKPTTSIFRNESGHNIFYRNWIFDGKPRGIVAIVHGLNSHSGYYQGFAEKLLEAGYECYALDLQGRGESEGERYYISAYDNVIADIDGLVKVVKCEHPATPVFLLGHSAGGVFSMVYALRHQDELHGLISESFAFQLPVPKLALELMKGLGKLIPRARLVKLNNSDFSRDQLVVDKMNEDPFIRNEKQPTRTMQQLLLAGEHLRKEMSAITLPLLILHGTADKATSPEGSKYFLDHASSADKQLNLYEGYYHDLLNDKYNSLIIKDILRWLNERS